MASRRRVSEGGPKENHSTEEEGGEESKNKKFTSELTAAH